MDLSKILNAIVYLQESKEKLIVLVCPEFQIKRLQLLANLGSATGAKCINLGIELGYKLTQISHADAPFAIHSLLRELTNSVDHKNPIVFSNLEILFEPSLNIDPMGILAKLAASRVVIVVWPGLSAGDHLIYGDLKHPEYRSYSRASFTTIDI